MTVTLHFHGAAGTVTAHADYRATIRDFLGRELASDPDRDAVLALAETFLTVEATS